MDIRRRHLPSLTVSGLLLGGLVRILSFYLHWPVGLVLVANVILLMSVVWLVTYDFLPLIFPVFDSLRARFLRRHSFFVILLLFFIAMQTLTVFLPSGSAKDITTTLAFLAFSSSIIWLIGANGLLAIKPVTRLLRKRRQQEPERVTLEAIITSMAIIVLPTVVLSFFFSPPGLKGSDVTPYQVFTSSFLTDICIVAYLFLFVIRPKVFSWKQLGLRKVDHEHIRDAFVLLIFASSLLFILQSFLSRVGVNLSQFSFSTNSQAPLVLVMAVVVTPVIEELYFRGYLFRGLLLHHKPWVAYGVSSLLFAVLHPPALVMVDVFCIGLILAYVVNKTKSLWPGIIIHMINNALVLGYLLYK